MNNSTTTRLYRALRKDETVLISSSLIENHSLKKDTNLLNEAYSHIVPSYKLRECESYRTIFSFTDDICIAKKLLEKHPDTYKSIGYVDVQITDAFTTDRDEVLFVMPAFRLSDWVELMAYSRAETILNLNYSRSSIDLINAVIPSHWSVLSLANTNREYILVCDHLTPTIIADLENYVAIPSFRISNKDLLSRDYKRNIAIILKIQKQLSALNYSSRQTLFVDSELTNLLAYYRAKLQQKFLKLLVVLNDLEKYISARTSGMMVLEERYRKAIEDIITINELKAWIQELDNPDIDDIIRDVYYKLEMNMEADDE